MLVQEVLKSVCKTENSLRRLKNRNIPTSEESTSSSDTISDEMKIREQIKFDVNYFYDKVGDIFTYFYVHIFIIYMLNVLYINL